jgi:hypothetical protein
LYEFDVIDGDISHFDESGRGRGVKGASGYDITQRRKSWRRIGGQIFKYFKARKEIIDSGL